MMRDAFLRWPSREALGREGIPRPRRLLAWAVRLLVAGVLLWSAFHDDRVHGRTAMAGTGGVLVAAVLARAFFRLTIEHRLWPSVTLLLLLLGLAAGVHAVGFETPATVVWCGSAIAALERLPLTAALPTAGAGFAAFALVSGGEWLSAAATTGGMALAGYALRLDAEARGNAQRLLVQERAARAAEAESAALAERARIAREIHDVLAHSLSAQLVHLEAARLLIERGAGRDRILERVVAARGMARDGLDETRQALSALRGELTPLEEFLTGLVRATAGAEVTVAGERRPLPADVSQTVRRVAQEALTNVRKHAPGARVRLRLDYEPDQVSLHVKDSGGPPGELAGAGGGYGLLGMRERAELLGGSLEAGPGEEGFVVTLKVPV
ncbi:sensor histidine kinase [Streptomyces sp. NPDC088766]|uniref:sensor histidine kinase n=1 Tax=Streptomyces sp. NPDC088766 TaxID=3365893 RepID=UPI0037F2062F